MPNNFVIGPTIAGQWPKNGMYAIYTDDHGNDYPALLKHVYPPEDESGDECGVSAVFLWTNPKMMKRPWKLEQWGWKFNRRKNRIYVEPCEPPGEKPDGDGDADDLP